MYQALRAFDRLLEAYAGPHTIAWHLEHRHQVRVSPATISLYLTWAGLVTPDPAKRPRSSYIKFGCRRAQRVPAT